MKNKKTALNLFFFNLMSVMKTSAQIYLVVLPIFLALWPSGVEKKLICFNENGCCLNLVQHLQIDCFVKKV